MKKEKQKQNQNQNPLHACSSPDRAMALPSCPLSHDRLHAHQLWCKDPWRHTIVQVFLEFQQLPHEVEVRGDNWSFAFDEFVRVSHGHPRVLHQVGDDDGGGSRDAGLAVDEKALSTLVSFLNEFKRLFKVLPQILLVAVSGWQPLVVEEAFLIVVQGKVSGDVDDIADVEPLHGVQVLSILLIAEEQEGQDGRQLRVLDVRGGGDRLR